MSEGEPIFLIVVAGGNGTRFGGNKLLADLAGQPVIVHSLQRLLPAVQRTILVVPEAEQATFAAVLAQFHLSDQVEITPGGACRSASVECGLRCLASEKGGLVAIHDGARPLATIDLLKDLATVAQDCGGAVPARPVPDSLKYADASGRVTAAPDRANLYAVATPQVFDLEKFRQAAQQRGERQFTDDAELFRAAGFQVKLLVSEAPNLKLTWRSDLEVLKIFL